MRALVSTVTGGPETLTIGDLPAPTPKAGELLIEVHACSINVPDLLIIEDRYQERAERPFAPGSEIAGTVKAVGAQATGWRPGDRVVAQMNYGGMAELAVADHAWCAPLPTSCGFVEAATIMLTYGTALHALADRGRLRAGETLLVLGAAGGVGSAAVEVGKAMGARVLAAVSSEAKATAARDAGADEVLVYGGIAAGRDLAGAMKALAGDGGADVIFDPVGGYYTEAAVRCSAWDGRLLVVGFTAGVANLPLSLLLMKRCQAIGVFWGPYGRRYPEVVQGHMARLFAWLAAGTIKPRIDRVVDLEATPEAFRDIQGRTAIGKIVVAVSPGAFSEQNAKS